jgi:hypothetical protein
MSLPSTIGLSNPSRSALADRQIEVEVSKIRRSRRNEALARYIEHGAEDAQIGHIGGADLPVHHMPASGCKIGHRGSRSEDVPSGRAFFCGNKQENASFAMRMSRDCRGAFAPI